jgi:hypothetical protein
MWNPETRSTYPIFFFSFYGFVRERFFLFALYVPRLRKKEGKKEGTRVPGFRKRKKKTKKEKKRKEETEREEKKEKKETEAEEKKRKKEKKEGNQKRKKKKNGGT